ncbi:acetolactate synthase isozyme 2 large subunit [Variibacter gotjawalensis]|uniref:Acetolactate synthase isozyme 2 large subunit n=1 Tax=Variibacter gotjawalensis TaxID=1333996 RepID=A0A0S3PW66_9BRAD|nr:thiamine pyrophosphate-dependent enzyme [Variibacter gotjawalensis]NIK46003.1 thiamine pyrophosphate-dependent acetolactate synthase large subunit-like protein [Variibacter gotjawalensis]RZS47921.1 thiamine pyrophosphate-dependent enzyme [Variibacter gotjawalensis]BAT60177.1 acetolactate synthase isozyme 2 large subunit [Variibacter gotjawalensis]
MTKGSNLLRRRAVVGELLRDRGDLLCIAGLGASAWDVTAAGDHPRTMPLWGGMGGAAMIGLGLALAQPKERVTVITGDGEMLMGIGSLATIAVQKPKNLSVIVLDNEHYGETGMQETHTRFGVDLVGMAKAAGFPDTRLVQTTDEVKKLRDAVHNGEGPLFAVVKIDPEKLPLVLPPSEGAHLKNRMREAILGAEAHLA